MKIRFLSYQTSYFTLSALRIYRKSTYS